MKLGAAPLTYIIRTYKKVVGYLRRPLFVVDPIGGAT